LKEKPQIPGIDTPVKCVAPTSCGSDLMRRCHYRAVFDDKGRIMILICSNTDLGDGWEREGEDEMVLPPILGKAGVSEWGSHCFFTQ